MPLHCLLLAVCLGPAPTALAEGFPRPKVDFSAEATLQTGQVSIDSRVFYSGLKERREHRVGGRNQVVIVRHDKKRVWVLLPEPRMYVEMDTDQSRGAVDDLPEGARVERTRLGEETVGGQLTTKYAIDVTQKDGAKLDGLMWVTHDDIVMKLEASAQGPGSQIALSLELSHVRRGRQDASLFALPGGYTLVPGDDGPPESDGPQGELELQE